MIRPLKQLAAAAERWAEGVLSVENGRPQLVDVGAISLQKMARAVLLIALYYEIRNLERHFAATRVNRKTNLAVELITGPTGHPNSTRPIRTLLSAKHAAAFARDQEFRINGNDPLAAVYNAACAKTNRSVPEGKFQTLPEWVAKFLAAHFYDIYRSGIPVWGWSFVDFDRKPGEDLTREHVIKAARICRDWTISQYMADLRSIAELSPGACLQLDRVHLRLEATKQGFGADEVAFRDKTEMLNLLEDEILPSLQKSAAKRLMKALIKRVRGFGVSVITPFPRFNVSNLSLLFNEAVMQVNADIPTEAKDLESFLERMLKGEIQFSTSNALSEDAEWVRMTIEVTGELARSHGITPVIVLSETEEYGHPLLARILLDHFSNKSLAFAFVSPLLETPKSQSLIVAEELWERYLLFLKTINRLNEGDEAWLSIGLSDSSRLGGAIKSSVGIFKLEESLSKITKRLGYAFCICYGGAAASSRGALFPIDQFLARRGGSPPKRIAVTAQGDDGLVVWQVVSSNGNWSTATQRAATRKLLPILDRLAVLHQERHNVFFTADCAMACATSSLSWVSHIQDRIRPIKRDPDTAPGLLPAMGELRMIETVLFPLLSWGLEHAFWFFAEAFNLLDAADRKTLLEAKGKSPLWDFLMSAAGTNYVLADTEAISWSANHVTDGALAFLDRLLKDVNQGITIFAQCANPDAEERSIVTANLRARLRRYLTSQGRLPSAQEPQDVAKLIAVAILRALDSNG